MEYIVGKKSQTHWTVNQSEIKYYERTGAYIHKVILKKEIRIYDIDYIELYFTSFPTASPLGISSHGHQLCFDIYLLNGSKFTFDILTNKTREELINAILYMKELGIQFKDKYNLIDSISDKNVNIWQSIEDIIKQNHLIYTKKKQ